MHTIEDEKTIQEYENYIARRGIDRSVVDAYSEASQIILCGKNDRDYGLQVSKRAKNITEKYILQNTGGTVWDLESFCKKNNAQYDILNKYFEILKLEAPHLFHSYLLYLEKDREEEQQFYLPKMEQLNKHGLIQAMQDVEDGIYNRVCISMPPGTQKCQPLYSKVLTPNGFIKMGEVEVGTKVIAGSGKISTVLGVSPVKVRKIYEVTFDDGSKTRCSDNHLWKVQTRDDRNKKRHGENGRYRIVELSEMIDKVNVENGKRKNYSIDYVPKIDFEEKQYEIPPYVLGVLIGDGSLSSGNMNITPKDQEILDRVLALMPDYEFTKKSDIDYRLKEKTRKRYSTLRKHLKKYGLDGKTSANKFIPKEYLYGSYEQRLELLRGLMDTDGFASEGYCSYASTSEKLAYDVQELVHSLGGYASVNKRNSGYKKNGQYIKSVGYYELIIEFSSKSENIFHLERKKQRYNPKRSVIKRFIEKIEYVGEEECKCIYIDDKTHLYITDDYIITHNTTLEKFFSSWIIGKYPKDYSLFFSHNSDITEKFYKGVLDITTDATEYKWAEIFPNVPLQSTNAKLQEINFDKYKPYSSIQCSSIGSKNAGKVRTNRYLYCDDLIGTIEEALNPIILDKIWRIYGVDLKQRKLNEQVKEIIIMTRWSTKDVIGRIIDLYGEDPKLKIISVPDIDPVTGKSNFDYKYNGMSVAFFNDQALTMDDISYRCLYKQDPIEREGLLYPEDKVKRYTELPNTKIKRVTGQCDTKGKGTDYFVFPCLVEFEGYDGIYYCVDAMCNKSADYEYQYETAANLIVDNEMQDCDFESNQGGDRVALEVWNRVSDKGWICNITDTPTESNKEARIFQCSSWVLQHIVFKDMSLYEAKSEYGEMMSQLLRYSVSGKNVNDDVPDVFSNFALRMQRGKKTARAEAIRNPFRSGSSIYGY